ncbi:MAG: nucleoside triphosphate pyrophosphatase [Neisseria sp.]|nr:nucleoside triphosphate pyrophosphatase [Neisseria sp.]
MKQPSKLYLASASPRRREILHNLGFELEVFVKEIDETPQANETAAAYVARMAREKNLAAQNAWQQLHHTPADAPIVSADTTVALAQQILGKPENAADARAMLRALSGNTHQVLTAVCISWQGEMREIVQSSDVRFKELSDEEIERYIATGEPMDKAGAYGIQGLAGVFIADLAGSFTGVMGLPVYETCQLLAELNYATPPFATLP